MGRFFEVWYRDKAEREEQRMVVTEAQLAARFPSLALLAEELVLMVLAGPDVRVRVRLMETDSWKGDRDGNDGNGEAGAW